MLTAGITNGVAGLVSAPKGCDCCSTILACDDNSGVLVLDLQGRDVDRRRIIRVAGKRLRLGCALALQHAQARTLGDSIVVGRAAATALGTARTITPSSARTRPRRCRIGGHVLCYRCVRQQRYLSLRRQFDGRLPSSSPSHGGRSLQVGGSSGIPGLLIQPASVTDGLALW